MLVVNTSIVAETHKKEFVLFQFPRHFSKSNKRKRMGVFINVFVKLYPFIKIVNVIVHSDDTIQFFEA